jgi:hypothetical protein
VHNKPGINAFGGNMPFLGGRRIATEHGERYADWLTHIYEGTGDTDYVGYFFHRAAELLAPEGSLGFIATNGIADGDNRRSILGRLVASEPAFQIHAADTGMPWPGNAQVLISTVFLARGLPELAIGQRRLDGRAVSAINSRLRSGGEWPEPEPLPENAGLALVGCFLRGGGFILEPDEAEAFLRAYPEESNVVRPFLTGDDLNNTPDQRAQRFVIDFQDMTLEEARRFPHALAVLEERVRPGRERLKTKGADAVHRKHWWRFANVRKELRERADNLSNGSGPSLDGAPGWIATARVSKHSMFSFVPCTWTPSEQVVIFPLPSWTAFAVLQSRVHGVWVALQATHMGEGIRYSAGECFAPFPFPERDPRWQLPALESLGESLHAARLAYMREAKVGLTQTYNALTDENVNDPQVQRLRELHHTLDRAVLNAYGWVDVAVPQGTRADPDFADVVAGRLFALNATRSVRAEAPQLGMASVRKSRLEGPGPRKTEPGGPRKPTKKRQAG